MREHEIEPIPGLPERLPEAEGILWQGSPRWWSLGRRALMLRGIAIYFGLLALWRMMDAISDGKDFLGVLTAPATLLGVGAVCVALLALIARLHAGATLYTVTNRRIVMRVGVALPMTINIPFTSIQSAATRRHSDGTEDIVLTMMPGHRASWVALWPHVRPWQISKPKPVLAALPVSAGAAQVVARALAASAGMPIGAVAAPAGQGANLPGAVAA